MQILRLQAEDWRVYRELRLQALVDAPDGASPSAADEERLGEADWRGRLTRGVHLVALDNGLPAGVASGQLDGQGVEIAMLWVDPRARGSGVADDLLAKVVAWARNQGRRRVRAWLAEDNEAGDRLVSRNGFLATGKTRKAGGGTERELEREIE
jgi:GNAT superfamily N-acetyltransferase